MRRFVEGGSAGGRAWRGRLTRLALVWGGWAPVGLFFASQVYVYFARTERAVGLLRSVVWQLLAAYVFAVSTPLVLWLARRFPIGRSNWRRTLGPHLLAGAAFAGGWGVSHITIHSPFSRAPR